MNQQQRIAFISEHASPLAPIGAIDTGGQNVYVAQLALHLSAMEHQIDIYTRRDNESADDIVCWQKGIRVIHIKAGPENCIPKEEILQYMVEFRDNMISFILDNQINYDVIHANFFMSGMVACEIKRSLKIPFVITFHALGRVRLIHQAGKDKFPKERIRIEEMIVREADCIIAECPQDKEDLVNFYKANSLKISVLPCGFNPLEFYPLEKLPARDVLGLPPDCHILLQLGRLVERKGIDNVIRSLAYLKPVSGKDFKLVIVGGDSENMEGSLSAEYLRLRTIAKKLKVTDKIIFAGRKDRDKLKYYYSAADLFITTPWYEPFGITPLEAMACGTPVIGANVGGIKFSVKDGITGALIPPKQPKMLAEKILELFSDRGKLISLGKNAVQHVNAWFTWTKVAEQVNELYQHVINDNSISRPAPNLFKIDRDNRAA